MPLALKNPAQYIHPEIFFISCVFGITKMHLTPITDDQHIANSVTSIALLSDNFTIISIYYVEVNKIPIKTSCGYVAEVSDCIIDFLYRQGRKTYKIRFDVLNPTKPLCQITNVGNDSGMENIVYSAYKKMQRRNSDANPDGTSEKNAYICLGRTILVTIIPMSDKFDSTYSPTHDDIFTKNCVLTLYKPATKENRWSYIDIIYTTPNSSDLYIAEIYNSFELVSQSYKYFELRNASNNITCLAKYKKWFGERYIIIGTSLGCLFFLELSTKKIQKKIQISSDPIISCVILNAGKNAIVVAVTAQHLYCHLEDGNQRYGHELSDKPKALFVVGQHLLILYDNDTCQLINIYEEFARCQPGLRHNHPSCDQLLNLYHQNNSFMHKILWSSIHLRKSNLQSLARNNLLKLINRKVIISELSRVSSDQTEAEQTDIKSEIFFRNLFQS
jgi:hypothetical protein